MPSLEENVAALTSQVAALNANFDRHFGGKAASANGAAEPAADKRGPGRPRKAAAAGPTLDQVKAISEQVKKEKSHEAAVALIKKHGANKLVDLDVSKYAAFIAACEVALNDEDEEEEGEGGDDAL